MPRTRSMESESNESGTISESNTTIPQKVWIFCVKKEMLQADTVETSSNVPTIVKLKHPRTRLPALYLLSADGKTINEIMACSEEKRAWIVDKSLIPSGKLHISTPMDPLFLVLPYLKESKRCSPLDHIVLDDDYPETESLLKCSGLKNIEKISDSKGDKSLNVYVYNEDKTLSWLKRKTERVSKLLKDKGIHVASNLAMSANFVTSEKAQYTSENYLQYAHGIVSEYLPEDLSSRLADFLNLPRETKVKTPSTQPKSAKRKENLDPSVTEELKENKKIKVEEEPEEKVITTVKEKVVKPKESVKDKARAKAAVGTKSISSFFKKS